MAGHTTNVLNQMLHLKTMEGNRLDELSDAELAQFFMFDYKVRLWKLSRLGPATTAGARSFCPY